MPTATDQYSPVRDAYGRFAAKVGKITTSKPKSEPKVFKDELGTFPDLDKVRLGHGGHNSRGHKSVCAMEFVSWLAGESHSDRPKCVETVLNSIMISLNDSAPNANKRQELISHCIRAVGSADRGKHFYRGRQYAALDVYLRNVLPLLIEKHGADMLGREGAKVATANALRNLPSLQDTKKDRRAVVSQLKEIQKIARGAIRFPFTLDLTTDKLLFQTLDKSPRVLKDLKLATRDLKSQFRTAYSPLNGSSEHKSIRWDVELQVLSAYLGAMNDEILKDVKKGKMTESKDQWQKRVTKFLLRQKSGESIKKLISFG